MIVVTDHFRGSESQQLLDSPVFCRHLFDERMRDSSCRLPLI